MVAPDMAEEESGAARRDDDPGMEACRIARAWPSCTAAAWHALVGSVGGPARRGLPV